MSLFSRLFGKSLPAAATSPAGQAVVPAGPPTPVPAARVLEEEASLEQAISADDMAAVGEWVLSGSTTRIRQRAARAIAGPDQLRDLIRATRGGKDKSVYRILTARLDELRAEARRAEELRAEVEASATAIARHVERTCDASFSTTLGQLEARWHALAARAPTDLLDDVDRHLARGHAVVEQYREASEADAQRQQAAALAAAEAGRQRELEAQAAASAAAEQARSLAAERDAGQAKREADAAEVRSLVGLLRQAQAALDRGVSARAARLRAALAERLPQAPALPAWFAGQLQQLDANIEELKDWKTFTVVPKRGELLQEMQSLVGADLPPADLAERIRRLRDEWRTLRRGAEEERSPQWQEFEDAAKRAFEPCREYFAQQSALRRENQARREALLERLSAFATEQSDEHTDARAVRRALIDARREWRESAPVDPSAAMRLQARFHALAGDLQRRLDAEYARNVETRRALIDRAATLLAVEDSRDAIEEAKRLQLAWTGVGPVARSDDVALWEEFRRHCDAIFQRSAQESAAYAASLAANQARATDLCEELEHMASLNGEPLSSGARQVDELRTEFESLELPRASARDLRQRFSRATRNATDALRRERAAVARRGWSDLFAAAALVRGYALATVLGRSPADREALRAVAAEAVASLAHAPKGARALLEEQIGKVAAGAISSDLAVNEAALRLLCVRSELIADLETPPEDRSLRRDHQMRRLLESMGRGEHFTPAELDELALEWLAVGPVEADVHEALLARFERCRDAGHLPPILPKSDTSAPQ